MEQPPGSNRGPKVDQYLTAVGLNPAGGSFAWCAAFVYWCFRKASEELGVPNPAVKTAGALDVWNWRGPKVSGGLRPGRRWNGQQPYGLGWSSYSQREAGTATSDLSRAYRALYSRRLKATRTTVGREKALACSGEMAAGSTASTKDSSITAQRYRTHYSEIAARSQAIALQK